MDELSRLTDYIKDLQGQTTPMSDAYTVLNLIRHKIVLMKLEKDMRRKEMYILLEKRDARGEETVDNYDAMGYAYGGKDAAEWEQKNAQYRRILYCPEKVFGEEKNTTWTL